MTRGASHVVVIGAALACIATSKKHTRVEATVPDGTTTVTSMRGTKGVLYSIESTATPELVCNMPTGIEPLRMYLSALPGGSARRGDYLCPPGGEMGVPIVDSRDDVVDIRLATARVVETWSARVDAVFDVAIQGDGPGEVLVHVVPPRPATIVAQVEPGTGPAIHAELGAQNAQWQAVHAFSTKDDADQHAKVRVVATVYGPCPDTGPCTAPADIALEKKSSN